MKRVLRTNPGEPQFPGRPQRIIKKKSGHIIITRVLFLTVLQLDVRHQSPTAAARRADPDAGREPRHGFAAASPASHALTAASLDGERDGSFERIGPRDPCEHTDAQKNCVAACRLRGGLFTANVEQGRGMQVRFPPGATQVLHVEVLNVPKEKLLSSYFPLYTQKCRVDVIIPTTVSHFSVPL